jgi:hypothetical protein
MNYTDKQLKQALADMLPELLYSDYLADGTFVSIRWLTDKPNYGCKGHSVLNTELLHLCWLVEEGLDNKLNLNYYNLIVLDPHASWQQRVIALAEVKGIEI